MRPTSPSPLHQPARLLRRWLLCGVLASGVGFLAPDANANASTELGYTRAQVYNGALRYLRIDLGYEITEKDGEAAYLLFRYQTHEQREPSFGAFEIVETERGVRLLVKLPKMPSYHETVLRDGLVRKLRDDYGSAEPKPPKKDERKPKQGSKDSKEPPNSDGSEQPDRSGENPDRSGNSERGSRDD